MDARVRGAILIVAAMTVTEIAAAQPAKDPPPPEPTSEAPATELADPKPAEAATAGTVSPEADASGAQLPADRGFAWEPFGYLRLQFRAVQDDAFAEFVGRNDGFELQNARVGVRGKLGTRAAFVVSFDGAVDEREQINTTQGQLRVGLRDAFVDVGLGGASALRGGFFQTWTDPESLVPDTARAFVDKPIESRGVRATEGYQTQPLAPDRSIGAAFRMVSTEPVTGPRIGLEVAVQNGADEYASNNDNNLPSVSAALLLQLPRHSFVVVSAQYNRRTEGELPALMDEEDLLGSAGLQLAAGPASIGGGAIVVRTTYPTTGGPSQLALGAHGQVVVRVGDTLGVGYRFGILDPSNRIVTDRVMEHTAGATIGVPRYRMRLQLQATHATEQRKLSNSRIQLAAEISL